MGKQQASDPIRAFADSLRERKGVTYGVAKLELEQSGEGTHVEYFRGKDLVRWIDANPGKLDSVLKDRPGRTSEESAAELVRLLFSRGFIYRTERKYKRPKPGRTRLVKWPRTLLLVREQQWDEASYFAWRFDRPTSPWFWIASVLVPVVVILACLFPLAPWWARIGLVYFLMGLLIIILGLMGVRYLLFAVVWATTGSSFWLFPNMMSDQVGILDAFRPTHSFEKGKSLLDQWQARMATAVVITGVVWVLSSHSPDLTHLKDEVSQAHDAFVQYMETMGQNKSYLNGTATPSNIRPPGAGEGHTGPKTEL